MDIGSCIYYWRSAQRITQKELARRCGIAQSNLSNIEKGKADLTVSTLRRIASSLGATAGEIFDGRIPVRERRARPLTRSSMEAIAECVFKERTAQSDSEREIADLFRLVFPGAGRKPPSRRDVNQAWIKLKFLLTRDEINNLLSRISKFRQRTL